MRTALVPLTVLLAALALVAAGCGGSEAQKAADTWADGVCSSISDWHYEVDAVATDFGGSIARDAFKTKVAQLSAATADMATAVRRSGAPDTPDGRRAAAQLALLAGAWSKQVSEVRAVSGNLLLSKDPTEVHTGLRALSTRLGAISRQIAPSVGHAAAALSGAPAKALAKSHACAQLKTELR